MLKDVVVRAKQDRRFIIIERIPDRRKKQRRAEDNERN